MSAGGRDETGRRDRETAKGRLSRRAMQAAAAMGIDLEAEAARRHGAWRSGEWDARRTPRLVLLTGPSGGGKSTTLRTVHAKARRRGMKITTVNCAFAPDRPLPRAALVDLFGRVSAEEAMRRLARAGLAEARLFVRTPAELSAGELFRLRLALAMHRSADLLLIDEFASNLDAATATAVAMLLRRYLDENPRVRVVAATTRDDLAAHLRPDRVVGVGLDHAVREAEGEGRGAEGVLNGRRRPSLKSRGRFAVAEGSFTDYAALAPLHYRAGRPATIVKVLVARRRRFGLAGVLVVSMPTLNAAWRSLAWPGLFDTGDKREDARRLNHPRFGVRCISRVIVDPRFRSMGLASRLVRAYLRRPMTAHTEAAAAMGRASRFFESAGMRRYDLPPAPRHARLLDLLATAGIEPHDLAAPRQTFDLALRRLGRRLLERELRRWSGASRTCCGLRLAHVAGRTTPCDLFAVFRAACRSAGSTPVGFAHTRR